MYLITLTIAIIACLFCCGNTKNKAAQLWYIILIIWCIIAIILIVLHL